MDLGTALVRLDDLVRSSDRMHLVQGDLMAPPFRDGVFDTVYSVGVIHHTPSARKTFSELVRLVKPSGLLSVWVYGAPGRWEHFRTNPLRDDRRGLDRVRFVVWSIVVVREALSDALRLFTVRLPHRLVYALSYLLAAIGKIPFVKYLTFSVHPDWRVRVQENFDWLAPPYQSHHTKEELCGWYESEGLQVLKVLPHGFVPKPGVLGRKKGA
jgi:SAM-dependent methyltransferase